MRLIDADRLMGDFSCTFYNDLDDQNRTEKLINEAPTVERPHGEWKPRQMLFGVGGNSAIFMHDGYECECGRVVAQKENFCPECGADMREEGDPE